LRIRSGDERQRADGGADEQQGGRFLPMLWPKGEAELKRGSSSIAAVVLVLAGKARGAADAVRLQSGDRPACRRRDRAVRRRRRAGLAYADRALRRRAVRQSAQRLVREGRADAARRLAGQVFRHVHDLSLRFHLERRTGSLTKIVERGTKSIDMMLYFLLFNIAPTLIELTAICVIFFVKFGAGLVAATLAIVAIYIAFTRKVTDWRAQLQRR
jgi:ABC-type multidrug transport system fused ATPase/permease subunit